MLHGYKHYYSSSIIAINAFKRQSSCINVDFRTTLTTDGSIALITNELLIPSTTLLLSVRALGYPCIEGYNNGNSNNISVFNTFWSLVRFD